MLVSQVVEQDVGDVSLDLESLDFSLLYKGITIDLS